MASQFYKRVDSSGNDLELAPAPDTASPIPVDENYNEYGRSQRRDTLESIDHIDAQHRHRHGADQATVRREDQYPEHVNHRANGRISESRDDGASAKPEGKHDKPVSLTRFALVFLAPLIVLLAGTSSAVIALSIRIHSLHNTINSLQADASSRGWTTPQPTYSGTPVLTLPHPTDIPLVAGFCPPAQEGHPNPIIPAGNGSSFFECYNGTYFANGDLTGMIAYSMGDCINACNTWNTEHNDTKQCIAVTMSPDLAKVFVSNKQANCYLKGNTMGNGTSDLAASASLCKTGNCGSVWTVAQWR